LSDGSSEVSEVSELSPVDCEPSSAHATAGLLMLYPVAAAAPTPSATANAPTRPM
jgi:hypothetical protein